MRLDKKLCNEHLQAIDSAKSDPSVTKGVVGKCGSHPLVPMAWDFQSEAVSFGFQRNADIGFRLFNISQARLAVFKRAIPVATDVEIPGFLLVFSPGSRQLEKIEVLVVPRAHDP